MTRGLIVVHTGTGKGKTTAALGLGLRAWGQGLRVLVIQFIKGNWTYGELRAVEQLGANFVIRQLGEGFVRHSQGDERAMHLIAAAEALAAAQAAFSAGQCDLLILDEINYAIKFGLVTVEQVLELLAQKPSALHVVLTGRDAAPAIVDRADLVTEMREIKHHYQQGIRAQPGIEF